MTTSASRGERGEREEHTPRSQGSGRTPRIQRPRRTPTQVPVASRDARRNAQQAEKKKKRTNRLSMKGDYIGIAVIIAVLLVVLIAIAVPMRTYYEGRSEINRLNESIAAKQQQRNDLVDDINKYNNEDYIKQEARRRLGMMEPGETAWRIIDPRMDKDQAVTTERESAAPPARPWVEVAWDSLADPSSLVDDAPAAPQSESPRGQPQP
ncbi:FtsB family cell division protein [Corynebacterium cystitidis]|uniref:FtsB family cell division protein n=1 Tax=Corynebacterium cystitidis TaxID=35757 RepID=UPI00211DD714|nr:septum formation initiator family protein [Corynebacterium cystitidis]